MMERASAPAVARELMAAFAKRTGLTDSAGEVPGRYLWTDAFAVCNYLELFRLTGDKRYLEQALLLVDQVHSVLGRYRADDLRSGWISGLTEKEGSLHPTRSGLRIGKELAERRPEEPFDEALEWDRDGQYYHYLTKWMHALCRVGKVTDDPAYNRWGVELARAAHAGFCYLPAEGSRKRLYWKMSTDLRRPLVPSMGQHDPLDGLVSCCQLQAAGGESLAAEIADLSAICEGASWATDDPLGIGGLLFDALRMAQLMESGAFCRSGLLDEVLEAALIGLDAFARSRQLELPVAYRLAFRELGLAIGLKVVARMGGAEARVPAATVEALLRYAPLGERIEAYWLDSGSRQEQSWTAHREINEVMLATCLAPGGFLAI